MTRGRRRALRRCGGTALSRDEPADSHDEPAHGRDESRPADSAPAPTHGARESRFVAPLQRFVTRDGVSRTIARRVARHGGWVTTA